MLIPLTELTLAAMILRLNMRVSARDDLEQLCWTSVQSDQNLRGPHVARQQHLSIDICYRPAPEIFGINVEKNQKLFLKVARILNSKFLIFCSRCGTLPLCQNSFTLVQ